MISVWSACLLCLCLVSSFESIPADDVLPFRVVDKVAGRPASSHYTAAVRRVGSAKWTPSFVFETTCPNATNGDGRFAHLNGWSASWLSVEISDSVELLVQRTSSPVVSARVHPRSSGARVVSIGKDGVVIRVPSSARFTVDFDGGLDEVDTGHSYKGPPMHTMSVFANPLEQLPDPADPLVHFVKAGADIPDSLPANTTLLFGPGVHRVPRGNDGWRRYTLPESVRVYLPSNAVLHAAVDTGGSWGSRKNITLEGYGVISGEDLERCPSPPCQKNTSPQGISLTGLREAVVRGVTVVDFPNHHIIMQTTQCKSSLLSNVKVLGWRANGDGVHVFGSWRVEKLFLRTQDDSMYTHSNNHKPGCDRTEFQELTTWNDANGASFLITGNNTDLMDSDVIYARAQWPWWNGGRAFSHRTGMGDVENVRIVNVRVEDPLPSLNQFQIDSSNGYFRNILFKDISIAAASTVSKCAAGGIKSGCNCVPACSKGPFPHGMPNIIGQNGAGHGIQDVAFENVSIGGTTLSKLVKEHGWFNISQDALNVTIDGKPFPTESFAII